MRPWRSTSLVLVAVLVAGCGGDDDAEVTPAEPGEVTSDGATSDEADSGAGAQVAIVDDDGLRFEPSEVTVAVGESVTWTHEGGLPHTVTATDGVFDSGELAGGDTFAFTAEEAGTVDYVCSIHPQMTGTVTVT